MGIFLKYFNLLLFFSLNQLMAQELSESFCLKTQGSPFTAEVFKVEPVFPNNGLNFSVLPQNWQCLGDSTIEWGQNFQCGFSRKCLNLNSPLLDSCGIVCPPLYPGAWEEKFTLIPAVPIKKKAPKAKRGLASLDSSKSDLNLLIFSVSLVDTFYQQSSVQSLAFDWNPTFYFHKNWAVRGQLGYHSRKIIYKNDAGEVTSTSTFPVIPLAAYINYIKDWFLLSGGGGVQFWQESDNHRTFGFASVGVAYFFTKKAWLLERVYFNYDKIFALNEGNNEFVLGVSFKF
jgi:hypothetical protein